MSNPVPSGYELVALNDVFMKSFGPVYLNRQAEKIGFRVAANHVNANGSCNGGAMATFADLQLLALAAIAADPDWREGTTPTISLTVDYLAPAPIDGWVEAAVTLVKATRSLIFSQAIITVDGNPVARSNAIYKKNYRKSA
ncbi:MAG: PaaI family thioesterase [Janthinobacterium lividum]